MNGHIARTIAEPTFTQISLRTSTVARLQAMRAPSYDHAVSELLSNPADDAVTSLGGFLRLAPGLSAQTRGEIIRFAREQLGLAQCELAAKAGVSQATLSRVENGDDVVSRELASRIIDALLPRREEGQ